MCIRDSVRGDGQIDELVEQFRVFGKSTDDMNLTPADLRNITAKTMIVYGDRDEFMPVGIAFEQYSAIPNSRLWVIPNSGHVPIVDWSEPPYKKVSSIPFVSETRRFFAEIARAK